MGKKVRSSPRTSTSEDSHMVTHRSTGPAVTSLSFLRKRTGSRVFLKLENVDAKAARNAGAKAEACP